MKIGFIGAGQMAQALAAGIQSANERVQFLVNDPNLDAVEKFTRRVGSDLVLKCDTNDEVGMQSDVLFLAVKPQFLKEACADLTQTRSAQPLVVSIVAGASIANLQVLTGLGRVLRVMPNTPCLVNQGASAIASTTSVSVADVQSIINLLSPVGLIKQVPESFIDAVTGVSGSGPAYVFTFIEALSDGGVLMGLPRATATELAVQTVLGAAELVKQTGEHTGVLRDRVASPGGTTIAGIEALELGGFRAAVLAAVRAATERSIELGSD